MFAFLGTIAILLTTSVAVDCEVNKGYSFNQCVESTKNWEIEYKYPNTKN